MSIYSSCNFGKYLVVLSVFLLFAGPLKAAETGVRKYDVPSGPLSTALAEFAAQAEILLSADAELTRGKTSAGLKGDYDTKEGLGLLLSGTGLNFAFTDADTVILSESARPLQLKPIRVEGEKIGRTIAETASSTVVIDGQTAGQPLYQNIKSVIRPVPNVLFGRRD